MVRKIQLVEGNKCYTLKIFLNSNDALPFILFICSYTDRPREEALTQVQEYRKEFSKTYKIPLEDNI